MRKIKKVVISLLLVCMFANLTACGMNNNKDNTPATEKTQRITVTQKIIRITTVLPKVSMEMERMPELAQREPVQELVKTPMEMA